MRIWEPWMTITVGDVSRDERVERIRRRGYRLTHQVQTLLRNVTTGGGPWMITLARGTLAQLGFTEKPRTQQFLGDAELLARYGLMELPSETVLCLCEAYTQPLGERLLVGMDPITGSGRTRYVFEVLHGDGGRQLCSDDAEPWRDWDLECEWVFAVLSTSTSDRPSV